MTKPINNEGNIYFLYGFLICLNGASGLPYVCLRTFAYCVQVRTLGYHDFQEDPGTYRAIGQSFLIWSFRLDRPMSTIVVVYMKRPLLPYIQCVPVTSAVYLLFVIFGALFGTILDIVRRRMFSEWFWTWRWDTISLDPMTDSADRPWPEMECQKGSTRTFPTQRL